MANTKRTSYSESSMGGVKSGSNDPGEVTARGNKGIPPGMPGSQAWSGRGVQSSTDQGNKGIPPMKGSGGGAIKNTSKDARIGGTAGGATG